MTGPFTLGYGAAPAQPFQVMAAAQKLRAFDYQLAISRGEEADLCRGQYIAMDLTGNRYRTFNDVHYGLDAFLSSVPPRIPKPRNYNFLCRMLGLCKQGTPNEWLR